MSHETDFSSIIEPQELQALIESNDSPRPVILDASFVLPNTPQTPREGYDEAHIEGALFFDISAIAARDTDLPHMLPAPEAFEETARALGISNDTPVIIYGQKNILMGPARAWWSFRVFGHDNVRILNGALPAWVREGFPVTTTEPEPKPVSEPKPPARGDFKATFRPALVRHRDEVLSACTASKNATDESALILDARPPTRFNGDSPEPRAGMKSGHIPRSRNIPCSTLVNGEGKLRTEEELHTILSAAGYNTEERQPVIATCGSGVTACVIALALFRIGREDIPVYDGSWSEWGREDLDMPVETK